ncbi:MAG TPA: hypothetical protein PLH72_00790 [Vicinamibacterales bacterium]|nr:hypothetical protein [Vicinamibacterales bacterium]
MLVANLVEDERELLYRRDDDLLALGDERAEIAGMFGVPDGGADLGELPDGVADLLVEDAAVGNDDDRVENGLIVSLQADHLVREPGDGVRLAAAGRVLDQVPPPRAVRLGVSQEAADDVELMVARPDLDRFLPARLRIPRLDDLRVVLEDESRDRP